MAPKFNLTIPQGHNIAHQRDEKAGLSITVSPTAGTSPATSISLPPETAVEPGRSTSISHPHETNLARSGNASGWKRTTVAEGIQKRRYHRWKGPVLMVVYFSVGLAMSLAHCFFYAGLNGKVLGNPQSQEVNLRYGTAFAFISQIALGASVWISFTQWLWKTLSERDKVMNVDGLNACFDADRSVFSLLNLEMLTKLRTGSLIAAFAWSLLLPPFFTPATLFISPSTSVGTLNASMPYPNIASSRAGHSYAYSPPTRGGTTQYTDDVSRTFTGPRTVLSLIATAVASVGEILAPKQPYNESVHSIEFFAPIVKCSDANTSAVELINHSLQKEMATGDGTIVETDVAYYAFVPTFNETGNFVPVSTVRQQSPSNSTNELWITFLRPTINETGARVKNRHYQVCRLHNATYSLKVSHDHGYQNFTGSYTVNELVPFPYDSPTSISNMAQHAYSAFMWVLCDQLVGKLSWYVDLALNNTNSSSPSLSKHGASQFGAIQSQIQRTSLLGSLDLDAYFELQDERGLYKKPGNGSLSPQRLMDKERARNRTLDVLIEELSFNISVGLMWDPLLTNLKTVMVDVTDPVNRYAYKPWGLFLPYGLANAFSLIVVILGAYSFVHDGVMADKKFQDIVAAAKDPEIVQVIQDRRMSFTAAVVEDGRPVFRAVNTSDRIRKKSRWRTSFQSKRKRRQQILPI